MGLLTTTTDTEVSDEAINIVLMIYQICNIPITHSTEYNLVGVPPTTTSYKSGIEFFQLPNCQITELPCFFSLLPNDIIAAAPQKLNANTAQSPSSGSTGLIYYEIGDIQNDHRNHN
jgi:hypothetical protein